MSVTTPHPSLSFNVEYLKVAREVQSTEHHWMHFQCPPEGQRFDDSSGETKEMSSFDVHVQLVMQVVYADIWVPYALAQTKLGLVVYLGGRLNSLGCSDYAENSYLLYHANKIGMPAELQNSFHCSTGYPMNQDLFSLINVDNM